MFLRFDANVWRFAFRNATAILTKDKFLERSFEEEKRRTKYFRSIA
jgi:hypothetical protein